MASRTIFRKNNFVKFFLALSDFLFFNFSLLFTLFIIRLLGYDIYSFIPASELPARFLSHITLSFLCVSWFWIRLRHYTYRKPFWFELKEIIRTLVIFAIIDLALVAFSKWHFSRYVWCITWVLAIILVPVGRVIVKKVLDKLNFWKKHTVIIGTGKNARDAYAALQSEEVLGFTIGAFYSNTVTDNMGHINGVPVINTEEALWLQSCSDDTQFIVALEFDEHVLRDYWLKNLAKHNCRSISVIPTLRGVPLYGTDMSFIFSHEVMILRVSNSLAKRTSRFIKRSFDIFCALAIIFLLSPILITLFYLVSKDGGNAIYGHERVGRNGKKFKCLKFRSMVINSQEVLKSLLDNNPEARDEWEKDFKLKDDPRITKIGHFIRKTSLDELPQLFNVLKGEMSLVGPRPIIEDELDKYAGDVDYYLMAKPGMTGLWQVSGRNDVDYDTRVYFDAWYVKNWSLWNDIAILFKTVGVVLKRDGAY
ncbi:undecaprenyl-phosphate galactose phosphotransferase WbaP [Pectobacterium aroidearum]|uniref:undecaprenyl-phosphate galactose phosphotransferase WbaP n=1 Tax=Pectobacterium aroidearum TaxID=1201031 RepID=UPI002114D479|nr:undecaprenyl-phosphate galactose phosphotransferase WbaP [Pectobacterium aroidearum]UUE43780.1 undecaprenyl-phosphate galactose phosphotransferase WbaP [Pectobacterium aroidearum]UUE48000.1 undecaprenyl-phosphate galactose phosphotransferase WbaP [Pectobacterium aroidearum]UUE52205.1 undecaprenyl-phosphate galactose phosphotransferase WbaP [Pectobacterium aroidearum]UUE60614.1 undecaprenyl-phosphate galactose phosphotransferase WbaP [Pectobacterium aroidearum]UUE64837.1 undecaprenyl-phospha